MVCRAGGHLEKSGEWESQQRTSDLETTGSGSGWQREGRYGEYGSTRPCQMQSPGKEITGQSEPLRPEQLRT